MEGKSTDYRTGREGTGVGLEEFGAIKRKNIIEGFIDNTRRVSPQPKKLIKEDTSLLEIFGAGTEFKKS